MSRWYVIGPLCGALLVALGLTFLALSQVRDDGALERVRVRGVLRVGMDASFPPFAWLNADGVPVGYEVELAEHIAAHIGVRAQIINIAFDGLYDALDAGRVDMILSELTYDARRTHKVIYSPPYFDAGQLLVARDATNDGIELGTEDIRRLLDGRRVAVEWGSAGDMKARQLRGDALQYAVLTYLSAEEALTALASEAADVAIVDAVSVYQFTKMHPSALRIVGYLTHEPYVVATASRSPRLAAAVHTALETLEHSGMLERLRARWLSMPSTSP